MFVQVVRQMARWTLARSDQGPIYLGYRLGHIKNDSRTFRALVYNKGALSLHMLRLLLGDDVFFRGIRRYYTTWRFRKAGTEDLKLAFEAEAGRSLDRYFDRWIYSSSLPQMKFTYTIETNAVIARFEQVGEIFDVPVTVTVQYANNASIDVVVPVTDRIVELRVPTTSLVRSVEANRDATAPVIFVR
jgi:aminopeptidase N